GGPRGVPVAALADRLGAGTHLPCAAAKERNVPEEINDDRRRFLAATAATVAAAQLGLARASAAAGGDGGELASIETATAWLNSAPLTAAGLRGKVVLVSFWTYTCINWLRSQPYLPAPGAGGGGRGVA